MRRERVQGAMSRWQTWRWVLQEVMGHEVTDHADHFGTQPRCLRKTDDEQVWLHPGFTVSLHKDDTQGYYLNSASPAPCWFVMWRMEEDLSYHDAGRWLDAQETVETAPAPAEVVEWVRAFAEAHFVPEPKRRQRPQSFERLTDRFGQPVSISTEGKRKGGDRGGGA